MYRTLSAVTVGILAAAVAQAHSTYIVPDADGSKAQVVFSDDLSPDMNVNIEKISNTKLTLRDAAGKESALEWKKGEGCYLVNLPGNGARVVYGITDYGVMQKGDAKPFRLIYYPKALIGTSAQASLGDKAKLEILVDGEPGKTRFQVMSEGKPVAEAEVSVILPGSGKKAVKTDKDGFTSTFEQSGRYGVNARLTEVKAGEQAGRKYEESRYYATLVVDVGK